MKKLTIALAALAAMGTVALTPEPASARPWGWHGGPGWHHGGWHRGGWGHHHAGWGWRRPGWGRGAGAAALGFGLGLAAGSAFATPAYASPVYASPVYASPAYPVTTTRVVYARPRTVTRVVYASPRRSRVVHRVASRPYSVTTVRRVVYR